MSEDGWIKTAHTGESYEVSYPNGVDPEQFTPGQRIKVGRRSLWKDIKNKAIVYPIPGQSLSIKYRILNRINWWRR
jgi:hypothetical protein